METGSYFLSNHDYPVLSSLVIDNISIQGTREKLAEPPYRSVYYAVFLSLLFPIFLVFWVQSQVFGVTAVATS